MLHFAYGANMDRGIIRRHASDAVAIAIASLADHRFIITSDGYASVEPKRASCVHGVLWRLAPRDRVTLDRWECVASGQYRARILPVRIGGGLRPALVYVGRPRVPGQAKAGYMELVLAAARAWDLPADYIASLERWLPAQPAGTGTRKLKEFGWT